MDAAIKRRALGLCVLAGGNDQLNNKEKLELVLYWKTLSPIEEGMSGSPRRIMCWSKLLCGLF